MEVPVRIKGRVGIIEHPSIEVGKFAFEISIWDATGTKQICEPVDFGPFETIEEANQKCREMAEFAALAASEYFLTDNSDKLAALIAGKMPSIQVH